MSDEIIVDPSAQGQAAGTDSSQQDANLEVQAPAVGGAEPSGFQKRIDQLTARFHQSETRMAEVMQQKDSQIGELVRAMTEMVGRQNAQPEPEIDADFRRGAEAVVNPHIKRTDSKMAALEAQVQRLLAEQSFGGEPPEVAVAARQLFAGWQRAGIPATPDDAVTYIYGQLAKQDRSKAAAARDTRGRFAGPPPLTGQSALPAQQYGSATQQPVPQDIDERSPEAQADYWEKRLGGKL